MNLPKRHGAYQCPTVPSHTVQYSPDMIWWDRIIVDTTVFPPKLQYILIIIPIPLYLSKYVRSKSNEIEKRRSSDSSAGS